MPEVAAPSSSPARRSGDTAGSDGAGKNPFLLHDVGDKGASHVGVPGPGRRFGAEARQPAADSPCAGSPLAGSPRAGRLAGFDLTRLGLGGPAAAAPDPAGAALLPGATAASIEAAAAAIVHAAAAVEAAAGTVHTAAAAVSAAARALALGGAPVQPGLTAASLQEAAGAAARDVVPSVGSGVLMEREGVLKASTQTADSALRPAIIHPGAAAPVDPRARFRRVAIIHYWLVTMRGGERVLERLLQLFPEADIFTHVYDPAAMSAAIRGRTVRTSFIQKLPGARKHYQAYLPLMPMALEQLDLRGYDLVISSESGPAKGVIPAPDALHLCYVHSPMRYLWDHYHDYRAEAGWLKRAVMPVLCHGLRQWDTSSAARVDRVLANSNFIRERIGKAWRREATVVHPPVDPALFTPSDEVEPGYLWVGQLVPYKRADLAIDAFNALGLPLTVVGDGPQAAMLKKRAGPTIRMIPRLDFAALRQAYARCRALVFTAEEDFGIVPVEVMASGRPVIAYGRGGALDSVVEGRTGLFFAEQTTEALVETVQRLERWLPHFDPAAALARAQDFAPERFDAGVLEALE